MSMLTESMQLSLIAEMAQSKKSVAHELSVLMLLHPNSNIRQEVAPLLSQLSDQRLFTAIDLRRLITLRNWVPADERTSIDTLAVCLAFG